MALTPILVSGYGRSGTTAVMALLATDPRVAAERAYPLESRYLTYFAKWALLSERPEAHARWPADALFDFDDCTFGAWPWQPPAAPSGAPPPRLAPGAGEWLAGLWEVFSRAALGRRPGCRYYAEKVPPWLPALVARLLPCRVVHLFRHPADVYLSANAFMQARGYHGFGRAPGDTDEDHARGVAHRYLEYFENYCGRPEGDGGLLLRYEDLVLDRGAAAARLGAGLGLTLDPRAGFEYLAAHRTAASPAASVGRWRLEGLAPAVARVLGGCLGEAMAELGYEPLPPGPASPLPPLDLTGRSGPGAWPRHAAHGALRPGSDGALAVYVTGDDFWLAPPVAPFDAGRAAELWLCVRATGGDHCSVYWRGPDEAFAEERCVHRPTRPARHWQVLRCRLRGHPRWQGTVAGLRLDLFNGSGPAAERGLLRWVRLVE
jgi:hypothetical protein